MDPTYSLVLTYDLPGIAHWNREKIGFIDFCYACWFIRSGKVDIVEGGHEYQAVSNQWVFLDPFLKRSQRFTDGTHLLSIRFKIKWGGLAELATSQPLRVIPHEEIPTFLPIAETLVRINEVESHDDSLHCDQLSSFYKWLSCWHTLRVPRIGGEGQPVLDVRVRKVVDYLSKDLGLGVIDYRALERETALSKTQIDRLFKNCFEMTPRQWCERQCLFLSEEWLREKTYSVKEIAHRLRFFDASHFGKWFRRHTGYSPLGFRRHRWL